MEAYVGIVVDLNNWFWMFTLLWLDSSRIYAPEVSGTYGWDKHSFCLLSKPVLFLALKTLWCSLLVSHEGYLVLTDLPPDTSLTLAFRHGARMSIKWLIFLTVTDFYTIWCCLCFLRCSSSAYCKASIAAPTKPRTSLFLCLWLLELICGPSGSSSSVDFKSEI